MLLTFILACAGESATGALGLALPLGPGQVRAVVIDDEDVLFSGISAEGEAGDVLLVNDRVRFVVQGARLGSWYLADGGTVIDADIVRPDGVLGRDIVEEWSPVVGIGRVSVPERVEIVSDGRNGEPVIVRILGHEAPLGLIEGAIEVPGFVPDLGLKMVTEYELPADSWLMEVRTTLIAGEQIAAVGSGDVVIGAPEVTDTWHPGSGLGGFPSTDYEWTGYMGDRNDIAVALVAPPGELLTTAGGELLSELADMLVGYGPTVELQPGTDHTWVRYYGVGPDMATLSDAILDLRGTASQTVQGTVTAPDGAVAGARVVVSLDGAPYTVAVTDIDGGFSANVPADGVATTLAVGRGQGMYLDLPEGAAPVSPYAADVVLERALDGLDGGATPIPLADGRGLADPADPLVLGQPATLVVHSDDDLPFTVRVGFVDPDPGIDVAFAPGRPNGLAAVGWSRDGDITLAVEPGTYDVVAHRGMRFELHQEQVTLTAGQTTELQADIRPAFDHSGWLLADPHMHGSPSTDGDIPMADRLITAAAVGIQMHFGTDHDHQADYRPLLSPLELRTVLRSVVACEVSPPLRGHFNIYPVTPDPLLPNNGAWTWWLEIPESTEHLVDRLRELQGPDFVLQANHPTDSGVAGSANWSTGTIGNANMWTERLQAMEVLNSGDHEEFFEFWMDLVLRGYRITPTGVSDSHGHFGGDLGRSAMFVDLGTDDPQAPSDDAIEQAFHDGKVVVAFGAFLSVDPAPGTDLVDSGTIEVEARSASWAPIERLILLENGVEVERVDGTTASFTLQPAADALYVVVAEGDTAMQPLDDDTPWAMAGPWRVDVGGNGWTPPLPPLLIE